MPSQDLNPCPIVRPNYKLNCVWCTVELKVIGNLECRIKFYREKQPRHFFYTIEYPYPPTNSVGPSCPLQTILLSALVRFDSPLQKVMDIWCTFLKIWSSPKIHYSQKWCAAPDPASSKFKKLHQMVITICSRLWHPTGWAALLSENISWSFFMVV